MTSIPPYDHAQIAEWLDFSTLQRGCAYADAVSNLHRGPSRLRAQVEGTQHASYAVDVRFHTVGKNTRVEGRCSCPVGYACKHVAAVLLANLKTTGASAQGAKTGIPHLARAVPPGTG
jgi:uncharacterized Zn finger protein